MTGKHPETDTLHWHRQDPEWTCASFSADKGGHRLGDAGGHVRCDGHGAESGSLFCALAYFFDHFAHAALLKEYPEPAEPIDTPAKLPALSKFSPLELTPSLHLRWLAILVGDLHQPLHWLKQHDYGREIEVKYEGKSYSLLEFWEDYIPKHLPPLAEEKDLSRQYDDRKDAWKHKMPPELFRLWAKEAAEAVCGEVYALLEVNHADGTRKLENPFTLTNEIYSRWLKLAQDLIALGGQRLAFVLSDVIEHKRHKHADEHGRGLHHHKKNWVANLGTNLGVAALVVPFLLLLLKWHSQSGGFWKMFSSTPSKAI